VNSPPSSWWAHSRGGIVISEAAERVPERIRSLVFIAAGLVPDGDSLLAVSNRLVPDFGLDMVTMRPDGTYTVNPEQVSSRLYNKTDSAWVAKNQARLPPDATNALMEPLHLSAGRFGSVPRAYIETSEDRTVPIELQRAMQKDMPCHPVFTLDADHCAFYSDPEGVAQALLSIAH
jgi:pimeloyl-ACP methyl ester carboxylesterase